VFVPSLTSLHGNCCTMVEGCPLPTYRHQVSRVECGQPFAPMSLRPFRCNAGTTVVPSTRPHATFAKPLCCTMGCGSCAPLLFFQPLDLESLACFKCSSISSFVATLHLLAYCSRYKSKRSPVAQTLMVSNACHGDRPLP